MAGGTSSDIRARASDSSVGGGREDSIGRDRWEQPQARVFNRDPIGGREKVAADVEKIDRHLKARACRLGYVIVFEECDYGFESEFAAQAEAKHGCRVRFIRGWTPT